MTKAYQRGMLLTAILGTMWCHSAWAERWTPEQNQCNQQATTITIVDCLEKRTKLWDGRLNQAYKALMAMLQDPDMKSRVAPLQAAQREWVKYRDLNCLGYYGSAQGTIMRVEVAGCMLDLTSARAIELQSEGPQ